MLIHIFVILILQRFIDWTECSTASRLIDDTKACNWKPIFHDSPQIYAAIENSMHRAEIYIEDIDNLYRYTSNELLYWMEKTYAVLESTNTALALSQLEKAKDLETRDCFDHCTYVLAKNNCNSALYQHACQPLAKRQYYIKTMIDSQVFPLIDRCQVPLMYHALFKNATEIDPDLYRTVNHIANVMTHFEPTAQWTTVDEMVEKATRPFIQIRRVIKPAEAGFMDKIADIMLELERQRNRDDLYMAIVRRNLQWTEMKEYFVDLVLRPCLNYVDKMHTVMDAAIFYGRIVDMDRNRFPKVRMDDPIKIEFFKLAKIYEACTYLDNEVYFINWRGKANRLIRGFR